jgi:hypothetical protein
VSPVGLDVREYAYGYTNYTVPDGASHVISTRGAWLVTRIQVFGDGAAGGGNVDVGLGPIAIAASGCLELLPGGAHRGGIIVDGLALRVIVEWWWQVNPQGVAPTVVIT